MSAEALPVVPVHSPLWHAQRRQGIGGSDVSAIVGLNKYRNRYDVWREKTGRDETNGYVPSEAALWGTRLEPMVADALEYDLRADLNEEVVLVPARSTVRSTEHPFMLANLDRWVLDETETTLTFAELKTVGVRGAKDWADPAGIAEHALLQCQHYMLVTGHDHCYVGVLIGGQEFRYRTLLAHKGIQEFLVNEEGEFWEYVTKDEPPPWTPPEQPITRWPWAEQGQAVVLDEAADKVSQYELLTQQMAVLKNERDRVRDELEALLGEAEMGVVAGEPKVRWTNVATKRIDTTALRKAHPDIAAEFTTETKTRRFTVV